MSPLSPFTAAQPALDDATWDARHRGLLLAFAVQAVVLVVLTVFVAGSVPHALADGVPFLLLGLLAWTDRLPRRTRACCMALALFTVSAQIVHLADGTPVAHFHYFVMLPLLALYEDRLALGTGVVFVVVQHGLMGTVAPHMVYGDDAGVLHPWLWAAIHGVGVLAASVALEVMWSANDSVRRSDRASRRQAERYFENAGTMLVDLGLDGRVRAANPAACEVVGRDPGEVVGRDWFDLVVPDENREASRARYGVVVREERSPSDRADSEVVRPDGERRIVNWLGELLRDDDGAVTGMLCAGTDVTRAREQERRARRERRDLMALRELSHAVAGLDDARGTVVDQTATITDAAWAVLVELDGPTQIQISTSTAGSPLAGQRLDTAQESSVAARVIASGEPVLVPDVTVETGASRRLVELVPDVRAVYYHPVGARGELLGILVVGWNRVIESVSDREALLVSVAAGEAAVALRRLAQLRQLEESAVTDALTGVGNRRRWDEELPLALARAARTRRPLGLVVMDLDRFKQLNDRHGHDAGDRVLRESAAAWQETLRETDLLARTGGDEFAVLLPDCGEECIEVVRQRLKAALPYEGGVSVGVAVWDGEESGDGLMRRADQALYADKAAGREASAGVAVAFRKW